MASKSIRLVSTPPSQPSPTEQGNIIFPIPDLREGLALLRIELFIFSNRSGRNN